MQQLKKFLSDRPSLSKSGICREAGISGSLFNYILAGERSFTEQVKKKIYPVLNKYGGDFEL